jgi:hypothetical protein
MHREPGRLVDHEQVGVLIDDVQGHRLRPEGRRCGGHDTDVHTLPATHAEGGFDPSAVEREVTGGDQLLDPRARQLGEA